MTVFVLVVVLFLSGGSVVTHSAAVPDATLEDCQTAGSIVVQKLQDSKFKDEQGNDALILDVQAVCLKVTQQSHA